MSDELKPCPFCGAVPKIFSRALADRSGDFLAHIICDCGAAGPAFAHADREAAKCSAIAAWNTRATGALLAPTEGVVQ